ncbi:hypothetical protein [Amycolatopsis rifamycinica]|uniref:Uncharacterized protein n=1 Tax=Amycolatopsis rifamycinica TaxID=287986 RepID=A0A066UH98_9PSEU|nr:hypothetical protein [Amycolatopsis rifamycinica]KDN23544.1 hypothetical protein DV20_03400 [Amycolatopsis rifamycinica]
MTALAAAAIVGGTGFAAAAHSAYTVRGTTHIAKADADLELGPGRFDVDTLAGPGSFSGTITLPPVPVTRSLPGIGKVSGTIRLGPGHAEGSPAGGFSASATWPVRLSDVRVNGVPYDVGDDCGPAEPLTTELTSEDFAAGRGGRLESTYAIGAFANCGAATPLINGVVSGPGNTLVLDLTPAG